MVCFSPAHVLSLVRLVKNCSKAVNLLESVIYMIRLMRPVFDWPIIMIGPGR